MTLKVLQHLTSVQIPDLQQKETDSFAETGRSIALIWHFSVPRLDLNNYNIANFNAWQL